MLLRFEWSTQVLMKRLMNRVLQAIVHKGHPQILARSAVSKYLCRLAPAQGPRNINIIHCLNSKHHVFLRICPIGGRHSMIVLYSPEL